MFWQLSSLNNIIDLHNHTHSFSSKLNNTSTNQRWLAHLFRSINVRINRSLLDVYSRIDMPQLMKISKLCNHLYWIQSRILRKRHWNHLKCICKGRKTNAPPPTTNDGRLINERTTHWASWIERSASSRIKLFAPKITIDDVGAFLTSTIDF
ncbi:hypothetical protein AX774_g5848 [Zancudomyces culisetae]|uniref:Uncharacterized protein n=1 Tax=Zancudomyces culisetae TaxID=1213189 RepID=A0A1R1PIG1_ZANCU|nr:hypothetical protein AX774_g5848 [Zancudomyces culisetae]|eukprot:OMH80709.1 hypothetical protein AX774_g5848 [Zancudomyces culisetae]